MSDSVEHGIWRVKATDQLLINVLDDLEPIQKLLNDKDDEIYELKEKVAEKDEIIRKLQEEVAGLKKYVSGQDEVMLEMARVIRENEYLPVAK